MKKVFTTGQVAKICKVAPRTVSKWFDSGRLRGYRIPGSQDRRIPREHLIRFLKEHGMPLGELEEEGWHKILIIGAEKLFIDRVKELLPEDDDFKYELANSGFEAGIQAESFHPDTIIIDLAMGRSEALQIAQNLRRNPHYEQTLIIALASEDEADPGEPDQLRLQRGLQEAVRRRPARRAHPHPRRGEAREHLSLRDRGPVATTLLTAGPPTPGVPGRFSFPGFPRVDPEADQERDPTAHGRDAPPARVAAAATTRPARRDSARL